MDDFPLPEPSGERDRVPPRTRTGLGGYDHGSKSVVLGIDDEHERECFVQAFTRIGWQVTVVEDELDVVGATMENPPNFFIAQSPALLRTLLPAPEMIKPAKILCVVEPDAEMVNLAGRAGADYVIERSDRSLKT